MNKHLIRTLAVTLVALALLVGCSGKGTDIEKFPEISANIKLNRPEFRGGCLV